MSSYSFGRDGWMPDGYFCHICGRPEDEPHTQPCIPEDDELEDAAALAAERDETCCLVGYDLDDTLVGVERLAVHRW